MPRSIDPPEAPSIPGLSFRHFGGPEDYPGMVEALQAHGFADGIEYVYTVDEFAHDYAHLRNCDLDEDLVIADVEGRIVGYGRVTWRDETATNDRIYLHFGFLRPEWRGRGIGKAMFHWNRRRVREIAAGHVTDRPCFVESYAEDADPRARNLLIGHGYEFLGRDADMVRFDLENLPAAPMPPGLEVRPVEPEHMRPIWEAEQEAFADHPGMSAPTEADYQHFLGAAHSEPALWRVAWDGSEVAGMVRSFINRPENERWGRRRGYTEDISVRRPWRRRGLARSLLVQSLEALRDAGMESAALSVYMENPAGALDLYQSVGFVATHTGTTYRAKLG